MLSNIIASKVLVCHASDLIKPSCKLQHIICMNMRCYYNKGWFFQQVEKQSVLENS